MPSPQQRGVGVGLASMAERAAELGGTFTVADAPGGGTVITAVLPGRAAGRAGRRG
ncbi:ATP-binding protein [Micromonospora sp. NPDC047620]|uniref:ATP-binding protein n=1 Tax=Micromonospora sp. NPDC047620 TaxID=3364251 RepID=UPI003718CD78